MTKDLCTFLLLKFYLQGFGLVRTPKNTICSSRMFLATKTCYPESFCFFCLCVIHTRSRLLTNFLCLPDRLIYLSRIDQAERFAWYQACLILIRQQPDRSGCHLILIWHVPDRSGIAWYQAGKWRLICLSGIFDPAPKIRQSGNRGH